MLNHLLVQVLEENQVFHIFCHQFRLLHSLLFLFFSLVNVCVWEPNGLLVDGYVGCVGNCCCWEKICWKHGKVGGGVGGGLKAEKVDGGKNDCWWCIVAGGGYGGGCCKKKWR